MRRGWIVLLGIALGSCGGGDHALATSVATVTTVRGDARIADVAAGPLARAAAGDPVTTGEHARARVALDGGGTLLLDGSSRAIALSDDAIALEAGRAFVEAHPGDAIALEVASTSLRISDAAISIDLRSVDAPGAARAYVVRGEIGWHAGDHRGTLRAGEEIVLGGDRPAVAPATLWADWTGGLVRAGPESDAVAPGMGVLEARVPDEIGQARWALAIRRLDVAVRIDGDLAITEVTQEFFNPASETVEGLYRVRVPEGAVLQRFAVDRDGAMVEGYVREQQMARAAYQAQVYRGSTDDPALLEWDAPGRYRARIYPIAAGEIRRISIRYAEWIARASPGGPRLYVYPMSGGARAPHVHELSFVADVSRAGARSVRAGMGAVVERGDVILRRSDFRPRADLWLELEGDPAPAAQRAYRAAHEPPPRAPDAREIVHEADERDYWYLPLALPERLAPADAPRAIDLVIVADVSAGTDRSHLELGRSVVESIVAQLGPDDRVSIVGADLELRSLAEGDGARALGAPEPGRIDALLDGLSRIPSGGATDLGAVLADAATILGPPGARAAAVVYVGDGAPTVGELEAERLIDHLARLPHPLRLYAIGVGASADLDLLASLTHGGGRAIRVEERADAALAAMELVAHAQRPMLSRVTVDLGDGIDNAFPRRPVDVVAGEVLAVVGRVRGTPPESVIVRGEAAGQPFEERIAIATETRTERTDLRLRWAGERLHQLLLARASREEIAELGTRYGLITPYTSYYVPSARELAEIGELSRALIPEPLLDRADPDDTVIATAIAVALGPLSIAGCGRRMPDEAPVVDEAEPPPETVEEEESEGGSGGRYAIEGAEDDPDPHMAREQAREQARTEVAPDVASAAVLGAIDGLAAPTEVAPDDGSTALGADPMSALGALMGDEIGGSFGFGGLGLRGTGRGGGGTGEGTIGLGNLGTIGHGAGTGTGSGYGSGAGGFSGRGAVVPRVRIGDPDVRGAMSREVIRRVVRRHVNEVRFCYEQQLAQRPDLAGRVQIAFIVGATGAVQTAALSSTTLNDGRAEQCMVQAVRRWTFPSPDGGGIVGVQLPFVLDGDEQATRAAERQARADEARWEREARAEEARAGRAARRGATVTTTTTVTITTTTTEADHARRRCSDAASRSLEDRIALWTERLARTDRAGWIDVWRDAIRDCEAPAWRDRRALLGRMLARAGTLEAMIDLYRAMTESSARGHLRAEILRRVRSPADLAAVRAAFGLSGGVDWSLVEQVLARATTPSARLRALRDLVRQTPESFDLRLRLLEELEAQQKIGEAIRLASSLRADPLADPGVRTAIGEMLLRLGREDEARRAWSEIVEHAPADELARRRLGDLYRAHGWHEDAYRQYATLASIRPDDPTVLLLLAQAAAGAGRVDEALRLEQRLMETSEPGAREGAARVAQLWSSVRFAKLRDEARRNGDDARLDALAARLRRSGVLRDAPALRVSLTWSHPDAQLALYAAHPGAAAPVRPADLAPDLGIEAFEVAEQESGPYRIEVRRSSRDRLGTLEGELVVVWDEGGPDERTRIVPLRFDADHRAIAWTITGTELADAPAR